MKKTTLLTAGIILFSSFLGAASASAADVASYGSAGQVTFEAGTDKTSPLDPSDPDPSKPVVPVDPVDPTGPTPGTDGPLSLDYASSFQFGTQSISTIDKEYYAAAQTFSDGTADGPNYVQVTDTRGTQAGWELSVTQDAQFTTADSDELAGASLSFANGVAVSDLVKDTPNAAITPTATPSLTLVPAAKAVIMTASQGQGVATWLYDLGDAKAAAGDATAADKSVKLSVPGKSVKLQKAYETTLTWTLSDTPTAP